MSSLDATLLLSRRLGHDFGEPELLERALTHRSAGRDHNERLEFLGDSLVNLIIAEALFRRFPGASEGELSRMRARLVRGVSLARIAREYGLGECLRLGSGERKSGGHRRDSILADALEAMVGAIYLDAGMEVCRECVLRWYRGPLEQIAPGEANKDAKTRLQELLQARRQALPVYRLLETQGAEHDQQFAVVCEIDAVDESFTGVGGSRRQAEQAAAARAIEHIGRQS